MAKRKKAALAATEVTSTTTSAPATEATTETEGPDIFDEQIAERQREKATEIVQGVADSTRMPDETARSEPPPANGFAAKHAPTAQDTTSRPATHAEAVGKRQPRYNEAGTSDFLAGVRMLEHHDPYLTVMRFEEKPSDEVRGMLREASFTWQPQNKEWTRSINFESRVQDRINAERVFEDICSKIRSEKGITHSYGGAA